MSNFVKVEFGRDALCWQRVVTKSGALAGLANNACIWSLRNNDTERPLWVRRVMLQLVATVAPTAAQAVDFGAFIARGFSAVDTGGTTAALASGNQQKMRAQNVDPTNIELRYANSTIALGLGTRAIDALAIGMAGTWVPNPLTGGQNLSANLLPADSAEPALILGYQEGLVINGQQIWGAALAGVVTITAEILQLQKNYI